MSKSASDSEIDSDTAKASNSLFVGSLEKGFRVLSAFDDASPSLGVTEIALKTGLDKSAAQRFSNTLHQLGYLEKDPTTRRYRPAKKLMEFGYTYLRHSTLGAAAMSRVIQAGTVYQTTVNLAEREGIDIIYTVRNPHQKAAYAATVPGRRVPMYCTAAGHAVLSRLSKEEAISIIKRSTLEKLSAATITDPDKIMKLVDRARTRGFASTQGQILSREINIAAPIVDYTGHPIGALQIPVYTHEWTVADAEKKLGPLAIETADAISGALITSEQEL